ncbi:MAG: tetratricopeptide repeat protein [Bacteroidota bacterium]
MKKIGLFFMGLVFMVPSLFGQNTALFEKATELYNKGQYTEAAEQYLSILENGQHSAELYFNLGNCYYKQNEIGPSIYYYEKALLLKPNDPEILNNLGYAQNMRLDAVEQMPQTELGKLYDGLVNGLSFDQWSYLAIALMMFCVLCYLAYYFLGVASQKRVAFVTSVISLILGCTAVLLAYLQYREFVSDNPAIIFAREVKIQAEPNPSSESVFTLHEGTKVNVLDSLDAWRKIKLEDGQIGWVKIEKIKLLKDF